ncbi:protein phosphatase 2C domain-containing protein [Streptomyces sp. NPDC057596]|uniref:protein phosphatase 2C domain-containing protein n=1 Tax=Streptomyces sp. NPDC057596 TaxID=3346178 RepID=UPI0036A74A99
MGDSGRGMGGGETYAAPVTGEAHAASGDVEAYDASAAREAYGAPGAGEAPAAPPAGEVYGAPVAEEAYDAPVAGEVYDASGAGEAPAAPPAGEVYDAPVAEEAYAASGGVEAFAASGAGEVYDASGAGEAPAAPPAGEAYDAPAAEEAQSASGDGKAYDVPGSSEAEAEAGPAVGDAFAAPRSAEAHVAPGVRGAGVAVGHVGSRPPTYAAEPTALPVAEPDGLDVAVPDTVLDGAAYGACTLRAVSIRGDSARYRGESRRDALLTARFGAGDQALVLVAMATGARATPGAHRAAGEVCQWIAEAVGRSHARLAEDIGAARRGDLKSGLHRLTDRSLGRLRAGAAEQGVDPEQYTATLRCLLLPADPDCRVRVFFGVGAGGLFRLREGEWQDIEPGVAETPGHPAVGFGSRPSETPDGDRLTMDLGITTPPNPYDPAPEPPREPFRFRASVAQPGDTLLMCTAGLADPLRGEPELCAHLARRWSDPAPPGLAAFLADAQVRVKGYADDRTAAAVWEA